MNVFANIALFAADSGTEFHAENKWFPESAEIIWGTIAFVIIVGLLWKLAAPPIAKSMRGRTERIANEIDTAALARSDAETDVAQIRLNLANVETERARILAEAAETAERLRIEGIARNDAEVGELEARAEADIEALRTRAGSELQGQVATWSAEATDGIVLSKLDDATLQRLVEDYIAKVGAST